MNKNVFDVYTKIDLRNKIITEYRGAGGYAGTYPNSMSGMIGEE